MKWAKEIMKAFPAAVREDQAKGNEQCWAFSLGARIKENR